MKKTLLSGWRQPTKINQLVYFRCAQQLFSCDLVIPKSLVQVQPWAVYTAWVAQSVERENEKRI